MTSLTLPDGTRVDLVHATSIRGPNKLGPEGPVRVWLRYDRPDREWHKTPATAVPEAVEAVSKCATWHDLYRWLQPHDLVGLVECGYSDSPGARLADAMSDVSEDCWCATWMHDCEYELWAMLAGEWPAGLVEDGACEWGMSKVTAAEIENLRRLSADAGGWCRWDPDFGAWGGVVLVAMEEWVRLYAAKEGGR